MDKEKYEVLQMSSGQILIVRGGLKESGNALADVYALEARQAGGGTISMGINRLDQATLMSESDGYAFISRKSVEISYFIKENSDLISKIKEVDEALSAAKSGIVLPNDRPRIIKG